MLKTRGKTLLKRDGVKTLLDEEHLPLAHYIFD